MSRLTGCVGNVFGAVVIIALLSYFVFSMIVQNIMQVDTIGDFDFELYKRNVLTIKNPEVKILPEKKMRALLLSGCRFKKGSITQNGAFGMFWI